MRRLLFIILKGPTAEVNTPQTTPLQNTAAPERFDIYKPCLIQNTPIYLSSASLAKEVGRFENYNKMLLIDAIKTNKQKTKTLES